MCPDGAKVISNSFCARTHQYTHTRIHTHIYINTHAPMHKCKKHTQTYKHTQKLSSSLALTSPSSRHAVRPAEGDVSSSPHFVRRSPSRRSGFRLRVGPEAGSCDEAGRVGADEDRLGDDRGRNDRRPAQRLPRSSAVYGAEPAISYIIFSRNKATL